MMLKFISISNNCSIQMKHLSSIIFHFFFSIFCLQSVCPLKIRRENRFKTTGDWKTRLRSTRNYPPPKPLFRMWVCHDKYSTDDDRDG